VTFFRQLHERVNLIPVIGKADTLTTRELHSFKRTLLSQMLAENIRLYGRTSGDATPSSYHERMPFAVVASNCFVERAHGRVRGRLYPWGTVEGGRDRRDDMRTLARCRCLF
jgi:septin 7